MLKEVFIELDQMAQKENRRRSIDEDNLEPLLKPCLFKLVGQLALIEARISLVATRDVDAKTDAEYWILERFKECLQRRNLVWDFDSDKIKMPSETEYDEFYAGTIVKAMIAKPEYILLSKAQYAPQRNRGVLANYVARNPSKLFFALCEKYKIDLDKILK